MLPFEDVRIRWTGTVTSLRWRYVQMQLLVAWWKMSSCWFCANATPSAGQQWWDSGGRAEEQHEYSSLEGTIILNYKGKVNGDSKMFHGTLKSNTTGSMNFGRFSLAKTVFSYYYTTICQTRTFLRRDS